MGFFLSCVIYVSLDLVGSLFISLVSYVFVSLLFMCVVYFGISVVISISRYCVFRDSFVMYFFRY